MLLQAQAATDRATAAPRRAPTLRPDARTQRRGRCSKTLTLITT